MATHEENEKSLEVIKDKWIFLKIGRKCGTKVVYFVSEEKTRRLGQ